MEIVWTVVEKVEIFIERSGEKKTNVTIAKVVQNFFRLLKFTHYAWQAYDLKALKFHLRPFYQKFEIVDS